MLPDERDTIAAIATPNGPAARGVVRVSGPEAVGVVAAALGGDASERLRAARRASLVAGAPLTFTLAGRRRELSCDLYVWPDERSYTRQPAVEVHASGSPALLEAVLLEFCQRGARLAEPGEFTLRAVLGGRLDLTQAEGVLGVIDARGEADLRVALAQLAGGVAAPLNAVREDLLRLLADLEAGLDFVDEEDVRFIEPEQLARRVDEAIGAVAAVARQASARAVGAERPTVVLTGPTNAGKSTLFNALRERSADHDPGAPPALVSAQPGSTRDWLTAVVTHQGFSFHLVDTAGADAAEALATIEAAAQEGMRAARASAALVIECRAPADDAPHAFTPLPDQGCATVAVATNADRARGPGLAVSAVTGEGLDALLDAIVAGLDHATASPGGGMTPSTASRCRDALSGAEESLRRARGLAGADAEELVALEVRAALDALGRVVGAVVTDDVLDRIFSRFCIGK